MPELAMYSKILVVDDESEVRSLLKEFLEGEKYQVETAEDGEEALIKLEEFQPSCILLDIKMPFLNGVEALKMIKLRQPDVEVIMTSALDNLKKVEECMQHGAHGYIRKPLDLDDLLREIKECLAKRAKRLEDKKKEVGQKHQQEKLKSKAQLLNKEMFHALRFPFHLVDYFDQEFACHAKNVSWLCEKLAIQMGISPTDLCNFSGLYHDIGKLSFSGRLLNTDPERWTANESKVFEMFPVFGEEFVGFHFRLKGLGVIIRHQCEKVDGTGFPDGLFRDDIPLESRILAVANTVDEALAAEKLRHMEFDLKAESKVLDSIASKEGTFLDRQVVRALKKFILNYQPPKERQVELSELEEKMVLSRDLVTQQGKLILHRGTPLRPEGLAKVRLINQVYPVGEKIHIYSK